MMSWRNRRLGSNVQEAVMAAGNSRKGRQSHGKKFRFYLKSREYFRKLNTDFLTLSAKKKKKKKMCPRYVFYLEPKEKALRFLPLLYLNI